MASRADIIRVYKPLVVKLAIFIALVWAYILWAHTL